jgi:hypothetical protein
MTGLTSGYLVEYKISRSTIARMEDSINSANANAELLLKTETDKVAKATELAIKSNLELDKSHDAFIKTANDYDSKLDAVRLYTASRDCSTNSSTKGNTTRISENAAGDAQLSDELDRMVKEKARIADEAADYALKAYQFVTTNCSLKY